MLETVLEESSEMLTELVDRATELGYLTTQDILQFFPQAEDSPNLLDELFNFLYDAGVEIHLDEPDEAVDAAEHDGRKEREYKFGYAMFDLSQISVDDSVGLYLKEMASVPLLTTEEEIDLAKRYERGKQAAARLIAGGRLSGKSRESLEAEVADGRLARAHIIKANTRLVVSIAKKYVSQGVPFLDLIQEGNLGLMKAVEKYDYRRGFRFSTYATWWIRQTITRSVADQSRTIRVPVHMNDRIRNLYKTAYMLEQRHGRQPTAEELAEEEIDKLAAAIGASIDKQVIVSNKVDPEMIGGVIVRYQGMVADGSLRTALKELRSEMLSPKFESELIHEN